MSAQRVSKASEQTGCMADTVCSSIAVLSAQTGDSHRLPNRSNCSRCIRGPNIPSAHLPPLQAVARRELKCVVVVVPALTECQDAHPPASKRAASKH